ncbi:MAG: dephospho-CoA kinase [Chloroflexi bacterium]|jgi:dephospho-CoA kinase|nr:MAG: dephospho-CoA kinase [Chloroflexota bacterium]
MISIGLTGGMGSGKTEASRILSDLGAEVIYADQVGHKAYLQNTETWHELVRNFGEDILQSDGEIDRRKLGTIVFSDPEQLDKLNSIVHPRMRQMLQEMLRGFSENGAKVAILEAAILIEADWLSLVDEVWTIEVPESVAVERVKIRSGLQEEDIRKRLRSQLTNEDRSKKADEVIDNSNDINELRRRIEDIWITRIKREA